MSYQTFADIFAANDAIRERLKNTVSGLSDEVALARPDGQAWSIAQIVEHISMVDEGVCKICSKLLSKARDNGDQSNGVVALSKEFVREMDNIENTKLEAPQMVRPGGEKSIAESLAKLSENREKLGELKPLFESLNTTDYKFSHPYFGELSAAEWLVLRGGHEARHVGQIERLLNKISSPQHA